MKDKLLSENRIGGLIVIIFGFLSIHECIRLYSYSRDILTGDHVFPGLIGILLVLFGFGLFFERKSGGREFERPPRRVAITIIFSIVILFIYCILITFIGYIISTLLVSVGLIKAIGNYRWISSILLGAIMTATLYFVFIALLKTPFPSVILSF
ncbi:tripartite tricarboxylate transporter TctB family protein [Bacillus sp. 03113]|uniref:tripartite tricarboxylate transporter TctB family protein n=1 Tax=Bacillus sp. 03113 TaxID=2578211 RepID=UPI0011419E19|nr:tripartite tricarboxylate transporter TctB family protein [Bacillus sp. 03113]